MMRKNDANHVFLQKVTKVQTTEYLDEFRSSFCFLIQLVPDLCFLRYILSNSFKLRQRLYFDRQNSWKITHDWFPRIAAVRRCVNLASGCAEINAAGIE